HAGILCNGVEIYVTDREKLEAVSIGLHIIKTIHDMYPNDFEFLSNNFFDKLIGNDWIRPMILDGDSVTDIMNKYQKELDEFKKVRKKYLMYK
ncbi:DUF1343 domain-containing protein, partial [Gottfriedia acidiceleris]